MKITFQDSDWRAEVEYPPQGGDPVPVYYYRGELFDVEGSGSFRMTVEEALAGLVSASL